MNKINAGWFAALVAAGTLAGALPAQAQPYPNKPIRILVPFVAGGSSDTIARSIGSKFPDLLGQTAVIENRPGANGGIAAEALAKAPPDGYTIMVGSIGTFSINAALYKDLRYDPVKEFAPISVAVTTPNVLVTKPTLPMTTVKEFIEYAKKNPGKITYGSSGNGSSDHLTAEVFKQMTGTFGVHIPYRGGAAAVADLIGGQIEASFQNLGAVTGHIKAGRLKALAVTSSKRHPSLPDVPTMAEAGYPNLIVTSWQAVAAPAGTPKEVVAKLHDAVVKAMRSPDVRDRMAAQGFDILVNSPEEFGEFMKAEIARWKKVVDTAKITVD